MLGKLSLHSQLTLIYSLVVMGALILFGFLVYVTLYGALLQATDQTLSSRSQQIHATLWPSSENSLTVSDIANTNLDLPGLQAVDAPEVYVRVFDAGGRLLSTSANLEGGWLPVNNASVTEALAGHQATSTISPGSGRALRLLSTPIVANKRVVGVLQVGQSLKPVSEAMTRLRIILVGLGVVVLLAAAGIGWFLSNRGLRPLAGIAAVAGHISDSEDFSQRLGLSARHDEIGLLANSFDALLSKVDETLRRHRHFVADCSHELRTPLLIVRGNLDLMSRLEDPVERAECLEEARAEAGRMQRIVGDLLLLAQSEREQVVELLPLRLDDLVEEVFRQIRPQAGGHEFTLGALEPVVVRGDRERLKQVVTNLVENALHYTPEGGLVTVGLERRDGHARLWVRDNGIGIAPEDQALIFRRFYRVDPSRSRNRTGAGLGLAIVRYLAEAHGGRVTVESRLGGGSTFTVLLPLEANAPIQLSKQVPALSAVV